MPYTPDNDTHLKPEHSVKREQETTQGPSSPSRLDVDGIEKDHSYLAVSPALDKARGPWPTRRCTARAATNLINGNAPNRAPREEVIFQILASLVETNQLCVNDFWGPISFDLEAEVRIRASLDVAASRERSSHRKVST